MTSLELRRHAAVHRPRCVVCWPGWAVELSWVASASSVWIGWWKQATYSLLRNYVRICLLRARASIAIARISYGNSVCPSVTTRYRLETRWDRDFGFSPYNSWDSLVFCDKISCHWMKGVPTNEGENTGTPLKRRYSTAIGSSNVKMVANRHRHAGD